MSAIALTHSHYSPIRRGLAPFQECGKPWTGPQRVGGRGVKAAPIYHHTGPQSSFPDRSLWHCHIGCNASPSLEKALCNLLGKGFKWICQFVTTSTGNRSQLLTVDTRPCWTYPCDVFAGVTAGLKYSHYQSCLVDKGYMLRLSFPVSQWRSSSSQNSPTQYSLFSFPSASTGINYYMQLV